MSVSFFLFIFTLIFAPLAFGCVEYWSIGTVEVLVPLSLLVLCGVQLQRKERPVQVPGLLPLLLLLLWMGLQLIPLPPGLVQVIAPATHAVYQPILQAGHLQSWIPLSVQPRATLQELLRFSTYGLFFILTVQLLSRPGYLKKTITITAWLGIAIAVEAIVQKITSPHAIYWFRTSSQANFPMGPWVYTNHFAGFMAMLFPIILALFLYYRPTYEDQEPLRLKITALFTMPGTNRYLLFGFGAILSGVSILLSASRGGIITLGLALLLFIFLTGNLTGQWRSSRTLLLIPLMLLLAGWLGADTIIKKFADIWGPHGLNTSERLPVLLDSLKMFRHFVFTGSGFGTYEFAFPAFRTVPDATIIFDHAHNDYIELLATGGLIGFLTAAWFVCSVIIHSMQMLRKRRERYNQLLTIGALTSVIALLLHSMIDFQMYNGANGLYFFFFCGLATAAASTRLHYRTRPTLLPAAPRGQLTISAILALVLLIGSIWYSTTTFRAGQTFAPVKKIYLNANIPARRLQELHDRAQTAAGLAPLEGRYPFFMAAVSSLLGNPARAQREYINASLLNPLSGQFIQQLALTFAETRPETTDSLLLLGCRYEPLILNYHLTFANRLIATDRKPQAVTIMHQVLQQHPRWAARLSNFIFLNELKRTDITGMLPDHPRAWYETGRIMEKEGKTEEAEYYYLQSLNYLTTHPAQPVYFLQLYNMYTRQHEDSKALTILRRGIQYLPANASFHKLLGNHYRRQGITYRAVEEYQQALQLNPGDTGLERLLNQLESKGE